MLRHGSARVDQRGGEHADAGVGQLCRNLQSQAAAEAVPGEMNCALIVQGADDRTRAECNDLPDPGRRVRGLPSAFVAVVGERIHWVLCGEQRRQVAEGELATPQPSRHEHDGRVARDSVSHLHQSDSEARQRGCRRGAGGPWYVASEPVL